MRRKYGLMVVGFSLLVFLSGCTNRGKAKPEVLVTSPAHPEAQAVSKFTLVGHTETGRKKWEIEGETANLVVDVIYLSPVTARNYGKVDLLLTAERGNFHKVSQDVHLKGDVVATTSDGARLTTDTLNWRASQETGTTPDWVTVTRPGMTVLGKGGVGYPKLKRVRLEKDVTVTLKGKEGATTVITCDGPMEVDYGRRKARFFRNVLVQDAKGIIRSDRMDVTLDPKQSQIKTATCWGHVEIHQEKKQAFCRRAKYWQAPGRTVLMGHPKLAMLSEELKEE